MKGGDAQLTGSGEGADAEPSLVPPSAFDHAAPKLRKSAPKAKTRASTGGLSMQGRKNPMTSDAIAGPSMQTAPTPSEQNSTVSQHHQISFATPMGGPPQHFYSPAPQPYYPPHQFLPPPLLIPSIPPLHSSPPLHHSPPRLYHPPPQSHFPSQPYAPPSQPYAPPPMPAPYIHSTYQQTRSMQEAPPSHQFQPLMSHSVVRYPQSQHHHPQFVIALYEGRRNERRQSEAKTCGRVEAFKPFSTIRINPITLEVSPSFYEGNNSAALRNMNSKVNILTGGVAYMLIDIKATFMLLNEANRKSLLVEIKELIESKDFKDFIKNNNEIFKVPKFLFEDVELTAQLSKLVSEALSCIRGNVKTKTDSAGVINLKTLEHYGHRKIASPWLHRGDASHWNRYAFFGTASLS
ncbi:uncharacterized protein EDB91DRAFT_1256078 [Suillus paluster]|uniref:uncharacterized protein n=1 Tax=Suillus paluster TaxID=48578 RepID=UPI001B8636AD|nr:uncharacterized protein EDB91DRAFT_1256078 [Suillus paluster]KAG1722392.1 hypothetical protein EDB91DRAFT_1256078 [Suillus paluster]